MEKVGIHGFITVELIKKHGRKIIKTENLLTPAGKEYILREGTGALFSYGNYVENTLTLHGNPQPYSSFNLRGSSTYGRATTNLLLNQPDFSANRRLYFSDDNIVAYAYADTSSAANVGHVTYLDPASPKRLRVTRRFVYDINDSYEFDTIALATNAPRGLAGAINYTPKGLPFTPAYCTLAGCVAGEIIIKDTTNAVWKYNLDTGLITSETNVTNVLIPVETFGSMFVHGNYVYHNYRSNNARYWVAYDKTTGALVRTQNVNGSDAAFVYYDNKFYICNTYVSYETRHYQLTEDTDGILVLGTYSTTAPCSYINRSSLYGNDTYGFRSNINERTIIEAGVYETAEYDYNSHKSFTSTMFRTGEHICGWKAGTSPCQPTRIMLVDTLNLLSYHTFATPIQKNIGDVMNVSYSYYLS